MFNDKLREYARKLREQDVSELDKTFTTKVVGVTFEHRQEFIQTMTKDTKIKLERDRTNGYDCYAVTVKAEIANTWVQVGFIPKSISKSVSGLMDKQVKLNAKVHSFNGFQQDDGNFDVKGLDIEVSRR